MMDLYLFAILVYVLLLVYWKTGNTFVYGLLAMNMVTLVGSMFHEEIKDA